MPTWFTQTGGNSFVCHHHLWKVCCFVTQSVSQERKLERSYDSTIQKPLLYYDLNNGVFLGVLSTLLPIHHMCCLIPDGGWETFYELKIVPTLLHSITKVLFISKIRFPSTNCVGMASFETLTFAFTGMPASMSCRIWSTSPGRALKERSTLRIEPQLMPIMSVLDWKGKRQLPSESWKPSIVARFPRSTASPRIRCASMQPTSQHWWRSFSSTYTNRPCLRYVP